MKTLTLLLVSVTCSLSTVPAFAADREPPVTVTGAQSDDPYTIRVSYRDLDLANAADGAVLRARVKRETRRVCGALYDGTTPSQRWSCHDIAWGVARPQIDAAIERAGTGQNLAGRAVVLRFARR
jgi:UrcA family protein